MAQVLSKVQRESQTKLTLRWASLFIVTSLLWPGGGIKKTASERLLAEYPIKPADARLQVSGNPLFGPWQPAGSQGGRSALFTCLRPFDSHQVDGATRGQMFRQAVSLWLPLQFFQPHFPSVGLYIFLGSTAKQHKSLSAFLATSPLVHNLGFLHPGVREFT
jgi:hypothetical protein